MMRWFTRCHCHHGWAQGRRTEKDVALSGAQTGRKAPGKEAADAARADGAADAAAGGLPRVRALLFLGRGQARMRA